MEKGIYISDEWIPNKNIDGYDYIYYGSEFCIKKIMRLSCMDKVIAYCDKYHKTFCFMIPFIPEVNFNYIISMCDYIAKSKSKIEIIVNDYGVLRKLHAEFKDRFILTYGRLLNRKKKSPTIMNFFNKLNDDSKVAMQSNAINNEYSYRKLKQYGITNIVYENVLQGNHIDLNCQFQKHILFPYVQISTSRKCLGTCVNSDVTYINSSCDMSCDKKYYILYNEQIKQEVQLIGNTIMYKNEVLPKDLSTYSRIIMNGKITNYDDIKCYDDILLCSI